MIQLSVVTGGVTCSNPVFPNNSVHHAPALASWRRRTFPQVTSGGLRRTTPFTQWNKRRSSTMPLLSVSLQKHRVLLLVHLPLLHKGLSPGSCGTCGLGPGMMSHDHNRPQPPGGTRHSRTCILFLRKPRQSLTKTS